MKLDRNLLQKIFEEMGYAVEFDSDTPGVVVEDTVLGWDNIPTVLDFEKNKLEKSIVKTTEILKLPLKQSFLDFRKNDNTIYRGQENQKTPLLEDCNTWRLIA